MLTSQDDTPFLRLAHISDLHFSEPTYSITQFFSKRWIGNFNLLFSRQKNFDIRRLSSLIDLFKEKQITHVLISGDFSSTSLEKEFLAASQFTAELTHAKFQVFTLPGNHDHYTKKAYKNKLFYRFFPDAYTKQSNVNLKDHGITYTPLAPHWWLVLLDTAKSTSWVSSQGFFSQQLEKTLTEVLDSIPKEDFIILANHFPLFQNEGNRKALMRGEVLRHLISRYKNIRLYLHGHTHRQCVADLRPNQLPIILDPGSTCYRKGKGGCHLLNISENSCALEVYDWENRWKCIQEHHFDWEYSHEKTLV